MSEENKMNETMENGQKKNFSVNIPEDDFIDGIPAPESEVPADGKPHKVVRYVDNAPKAEKTEKKKGNVVGEFFAGAAAGAKTVGEGISAGIKTVSEKKPKAEKPVKEEKPKKAAKPAPEADETQFPKDEKKSGSALDSVKAKLNSLPTGAVIGGAIGILVVLIAIILLIAGGCSADDQPSRPNNPGSEIVIGGEDEKPGSEEVPGNEEKEFEYPERKDSYVEAFNANNDVVAWLYIPELEDVDAGVCFSYDKSYPYNKRDITGKKIPNSYWIDGAYYTHYRNFFGDTSAELSTNTVIFGHSDLGKENLAYTNDDPTGPLFSQLFSFKDPSFAEKTPYIYLTLPEENTVWEIFAVFYNDAKALNSTFAPYYKSGAGDLWYIEPSPSNAEYELMLQKMQERSLYDYDVEVAAGDQILTLSTCTVAYGLPTRDNYRFVIVAKLVTDPSRIADKNAVFTINENAPIPDTYRDEFDEYLSTWKPSEN